MCIQISFSHSPFHNLGKHVLNKQWANIPINVIFFTFIQDLATSGSKAPTPTALQFHKFEEWSHSNQQIYKLQSKILDLEAAKIRLVIFDERNRMCSQIITDDCVCLLHT